VEFLLDLQLLQGSQYIDAVQHFLIAPQQSSRQSGPGGESPTSHPLM
jgi:hypothetical protein